MSQFKDETRAVICLLQEGQITKKTAHRAVGLIIRLNAEIERLEKRLAGEKHALFEQQAYTAKLQAEIERLEAYNANLEAANSHISNTLWDEVVNAKTEAIKEFAQLVKEHLDDFYHTDDGSLLDTVSMVDLLVKEMTEDQK